jgi:hypothetical protein
VLKYVSRPFEAVFSSSLPEANGENIMTQFWVRKMKLWSRGLAILAIVLPTICVEVAAQNPPQRWRIEGVLSTGETFNGEIIRSNDEYFRLRDAESRRTLNVYQRNVVDFTLTLPEEQQKLLDEASPADQPLVKARLLLGEKMAPLAELTLIRHLKRNPGSAEAIAELYTRQDVTLPVSLGGEETRRNKPRRYQLATADQIEKNLEKASEYAEKMKQIAPKTHEIETDHFVIYSAWSRRDDRVLKRVYENLYDKLTEQFDLPEEEHIWIGKLPVYAFWERDDFVKFNIDVTGITKSADDKQPGGYAGRRGLFQYVVLGAVKEGRSDSHAKTWFQELLVHESTHAFNARYFSQRGLPSWVDEGIAETIASEIVSDSNASYKLRSAHRDIKNNENVGRVKRVFGKGNIPLDGFYYGVSQSMVRYLISRDRMKFIDFVKGIKEGKDPEAALKETFGYESYEDFARDWAGKVR